MVENHKTAGVPVARLELGDRGTVVTVIRTQTYVRRMLTATN